MPRVRLSTPLRPLALGLALVCGGLASGAGGAGLPSAAETESFTAASKLFEDKLYDLAEKRFAEFAAKYPDSDRRPAALLYEAEALYSENNLDAAQGLLSANLAKAGDAADRYTFWLAKVSFQRGKFAEAADGFLKVVKEFPNSALRTESFYGQGAALAKTGDWRLVLEAVGPGNALFTRAAAAKPDDEAVSRSLLLAAEANSHLGSSAAAAQGLAELGSRKLPPDLAWRRLYLLCKLEIDAGRPASALALTTNLTEIAVSVGQQALQAESVLLQGEVLEKLERRTEAADLYERNLGLLAPEARSRARLKIVNNYLEDPHADNTSNTTVRLEALIQQSPKDEAADLARLTLGEFRLKRFLREAAAGSLEGAAFPPGASNTLSLALTNFNQVIEAPQAASLSGRALADAGWCFWFLGRIREAEAAFQKAVERLPPSESRVAARFKLADAEFKLGELEEAQTNYRAVLLDEHALGDKNAGLFDQALHQLLRTSLLRDDPAAAEAAVGDLLRRFPGSALTDRNLYLFGGALIQARKPEEARDLLSEFAQKFPDSPLRAEAELAVAETFMESGDFAEALRRYGEWKVRHPGDRLLARAAFSEALAADKAGFETNSFSMMTNFLAMYPAHPLGPLARKWVADSLFNRQIYTEAERNYQELYSATNAPRNLAYEARLMAGRSAYERQGVGEAATYFKQLMDLLQKETNAPPVLVAETSILLGDTLFQQYLQSTNRSGQDIWDVIPAFGLATNAMPGTIYEARALGRIGDYDFEFSALKESLSKDHSDPNNYTNALANYEAVLACKGADDGLRGQAEVKIGLILERRKLPQQALERYLDLVYPKEKPGPGGFYWLYRAGMEAARIYEEGGQPEKAASIYARLAEKLPAFKAALDKRIALLRQKK
jgi:TolA-binding protein